MADPRGTHLTEEQLARFQDGELTGPQASHMEWCEECKLRLGDLQATLSAWREYRADAPIPEPPRPWRGIVDLHQEAERQQARNWRWWQIPAAAIALFLVVFTVTVLRRPPEFDSGALLERSANVALPEGRTLAVRMAGRTLLRPAVLIGDGDPQLAHVAGLFGQAHYSWREPFSARSYRDWRAGVVNRHDRVVVSDAGDTYRIETEAPSGILRTASLTLRAKDLRPTRGDFQFEGELPLEIGETETPFARPLPVAPGRKAPVIETPATPADTLRVLAALNRIGADAGDPVEVTEDELGRIVVNVALLTAERRQEVASAVQSLPRVRLESELKASPATRPNARPAEKYSTGMPASVRRTLEEKLGGPVGLQEITDSVLDAADQAVSRAHAVDVLAEKFPPMIEATLSQPDRELLNGLRAKHLTELRHLTGRIGDQLKPLLRPATASPVSSTRLQPSALELDSVLTQLLAGSYSETQATALLRTLPARLAQLNAGIDARQDIVK